MSEKNGSQPVKPTVDELRAEIKQTRTELGETVQALAAKADVKARAKDQVELTKQKVKAQAVEAGEKVREAAVAAGDKVRAVAAQASDKAHQAADKAHQVSDRPYQATDPFDPAGQPDRLRTPPVPLSLVFAGVVAVVGLILIVRGRRR